MAHVGVRRLTVLLGEWEVGGSTYHDLAERIRLLIMDGRLPVGARLPSERELAGQLGKSRSTIVSAYNRLREDGYAVSRQGSGTLAALPSGGRPTSVLDFAHAVPPPIEGLATRMRRVLEHVDRAVAGPGFDMQGDAGLRSRIAERYTRQGVPTSLDQVMITVGGQHAISLVTRALSSHGERVLAESPSYPHAYEAARAAGGQVVTTPVDRDGWDADHLLTAMERTRPALAYLVPDFQNPTGASMPGELRSTVAEAARRTATTLVIDETTADLDIDRGWSDGPFVRHAADTGAEIVTVGSLSKSMWTGLRVGWIRASTDIIDRLVRVRPSMDLGSPRLEQLVACELFDDLPELLGARRAQLRAGRDHLRRELQLKLPSWEAPKVAGGLSLWVGLGRPMSSSLALLSQARGLVISAGPRFTVDGSQERYLRLPFTMPAEDLTAGVDVLRAAWSAMADFTTTGYETEFHSVV